MTCQLSGRRVTLALAAATLLAGGGCQRQPRPVQPAPELNFDSTAARARRSEAPAAEPEHAREQPERPKRAPLDPESVPAKPPADPADSRETGNSRSADSGHPSATKTAASETARSSGGGGSDADSAAPSSPPQDSAGGRVAELPGRRPPPKLPPAKAAEAAAQELRRARAALSQGQLDSAYEHAAAAFAQASVHSSDHDTCRELATAAERIIDAVGRQQGPPANVPTRFE